MTPLATTSAPPLVIDDLQLCQCVREALRSTGYAPLGRVQVGSSRGDVTLRGMVPTYHLKQVAQTACRSVPGVRSISNELVVGGRQHVS